MIKEKSHTKKVDVYSFGVVLWELLTGLVPFNGLTPEQAAFAVAQKKRQHALFCDTPSKEDLPSQRHTMEEDMELLASIHGSGADLSEVALRDTSVFDGNMSC